MFNRFKNNPAIVALGISGLAMFLLASPAKAETLGDALVKAYNNNPTLRAERANLRATDESVAQARSGWRPAVTVSGSVGHQESESRSPFFSSKRTITPKTRSARLSQPIYQGGRTFSENKRAKKQVLAERASLRLTEQDVLLSAVEAYMNVLRDEAVLDLNRNNERVLERQLQASRDRFEVGEITRTDVAQSEARLSGAVSSRFGAEASLAGSRASYERVVGNPPRQLEPAPALPRLPANRQMAMDIADELHPRIDLAEYSAEAAKHAIRSAQAEILPQISVDLAFNQVDDAIVEGSLSRDKSVTANLSLPLYQGGAAQSRVRQAKQRYSQRRIQILEAQRQVYQEVTTAFEDLRAARATIESSSKQVEANEIALDGVRQEAEVGSRTTLDVLDAEQELLDSRVQLVEAERNEYVAAFRLLAAVGRLNADWLELPVDSYDPTRHYDRVKNKFFGWGSIEE